MADKKIILSAAVLTFDIMHRKILLSKRMNCLHAVGLYSCPGGKLDPGETLHECAAREFREETGLLDMTAKYMVALGYVSNHFNTAIGQVVCHWFCTSIFGGPVTHVEKNPDGTPKNAGWEWHDVDNLPDPIMGGVRSAVAHWYRPYGHPRNQEFRVLYGGDGYENGVPSSGPASRLRQDEP